MAPLHQLQVETQGMLIWINLSVSSHWGFPNLYFILGIKNESLSTLFPYPPNEYGISHRHILEFLPKLLSSNFLDRNWKWTAAVQLLHGREQIVNPPLSSSQGRTCSVTRKYSWLQCWFCPHFLWVIFVSSLQYNYFFQLSYLIVCQSHFLWVKKSDIQSWILTYLIFILIIPFIIFISILGWQITCGFYFSKFQSELFWW